MYEKRCRENKEGQEKGNQTTKMPEMKQTNKKKLRENRFRFGGENGVRTENNLGYF